MVADVKMFMMQCPHRLNTRAGEVIPRPYGEAVDRLVPIDVNFDFLDVDTSGQVSFDDLPEYSECCLFIVIIDVVGNSVCLQPTVSCIADVTI